MKIGIVGSEGKKFTEETEAQAREIIRRIISVHTPTAVVSGACHLGGIDSWAIAEASKYPGIELIEFPPAIQQWSGGYKERNIQIAEASSIVYCITVRKLPPGFGSMHRYEFCYHCNTDAHIKSGGCWTVKYARKLGKLGEIIVV